MYCTVALQIKSNYNEYMKFNLFCSLDEDIWEVRIHFDAREPLEMKLCGSDITYLNLVAVMETQGFNAYDCLYNI